MISRDYQDDSINADEGYGDDYMPCTEEEFKSMIERVERFIEKIEEREYIITKEAQAIEFKDIVTNSKTNLAAELAHWIHIYRTRGNRNWSTVSKLLQYIDMALTHDTIRDNDVQTQKAKDSEKRYNTLREEYNELAAKHNELADNWEKLHDDFLILQGRKAELDEKFDRIVPKGEKDYHE